MWIKNMCNDVRQCSILRKYNTEIGCKGESESNKDGQIININEK